MPWGGPPERRPLRFACHSLEKMDANRYLCYADLQSPGQGSQADDTCLCGTFRICPWDVFDCVSCALQESIPSQPHANCTSPPSLTVSSRPCVTNVQVSQQPTEPDHFSGNAVPAVVLLVTIELLMLYLAFRLGQYSGLIRTGGSRRLKERLLEMSDLNKPSPESGQTQLPKAAVGAVPPPPAPEPPSCKENGVEEGQPSAIPTEDKEAAAVDQASTTADLDPAKVDWKNFSSAFSKRGVHEPFPSLDIAPDISEEEVNALLEDEGIGVKDLLEECCDPAKRREIARKFLARFPVPESKWDGESVLMTADKGTTYWVAGDIHAKVSAIAKICAVISDRHRRGLAKERNVLILLGDFVDRGDEPLETLAFIESLKLKPLFDGFDVITLKGNHDVGLARDADGKYMSMVSPAETAELFQECVSQGKDISVEADAAMRLAKVSVRMCELTGIDVDDRSRTMLFVHGGVPHVDLQEKLYEVRNHISQGESFFKALAGEAVPEELRRNCAEDFTWIRFAKDLPVKQPNRGSRGCEIGTEDVSRYISLHRALTARDITFIFRGHDHERPGYACYSPHDALNPTKKKFAQRECNVLTLNAMEPDHSSSGLFRERDLALAEWTLGNSVRLHRIITHHLEIAKEVRLEPEAGESSLVAQPGSSLPPVIQPEDLLQGSAPARSVEAASEEQEKVEEK